MNKLCILTAAVMIMAVAGVSAQTTYMKAAPSEPPPAAKSAPAKSTKKTPTISSKCQVPGKSTTSSC